MKTRRVIDMVMSVLVAFVLMAGGFARFHHHTHDNRTCFCFTLSDAKVHSETHAHNDDTNDCCDHKCGGDLCAFVLDDFQISQENDDYSGDFYANLPFAILPCYTVIVPQNTCHTPICHRCIKSLIDDIDQCAALLRAPPAIV